MHPPESRRLSARKAASRRTKPSRPRMAPVLPIHDLRFTIYCSDRIW